MSSNNNQQFINFFKHDIGHFFTKDCYRFFSRLPNILFHHYHVKHYHVKHWYDFLHRSFWNNFITSSFMYDIDACLMFASLLLYLSLIPKMRRSYLIYKQKKAHSSDSNNLDDDDDDFIHMNKKVPDENNIIAKSAILRQEIKAAHSLPEIGFSGSDRSSLFDMSTSTASEEESKTQAELDKELQKLKIAQDQVQDQVMDCEFDL